MNLFFKSTAFSNEDEGSAEENSKEDDDDISYTPVPYDQVLKIVDFLIVQRIENLWKLAWT